MISHAPWYTELLAAAAATGALALLWKVLLWNVFKALWAAIVAAPLIAAGLDELVQLVKGDVLGRLDAGAKRFEADEHRIEKAELLLVDHEERIQQLEHPPTPLTPGR